MHCQTHPLPKLFWILKGHFIEVILFIIFKSLLLFNQFYFGTLVFFFILQRFFVLDNGILKYSKTPIDVSNPDRHPCR